jgi:predicted HD phosphohydrolase
MKADDVELQVAGLLHDVAHGLCHIRDHAEVGANALRDLMNDRVNALIALHVAAKRYLVTTQSDYRDRLSPTSVRSFEAQGGDMSPEEVARFAQDPLRDDALLLREADDAAKVVGKIVPGLETWRDALRACARTA